MTLPAASGRPDGGSRPGRPRLRNVAKWLGAVAVCAALAELGIRVLLSHAHWSPPVFRAEPLPLGYALGPGIQVQARQLGRTVQISTDPGGHRRTVGTPEAPGARAVHLIGDSQVFGWGLSDDETVATQLQRSLGGSFRVVNHGVPGYGPAEYLKVLERVSASDDVVVLLTEENDAADVYGLAQPAHVACGFIATVAHDSTAACMLMQSRLVQGLFEVRHAFHHRYLMTPLGFSDHSTVAGRVLAGRANRWIAQVRQARQGRVIVTIVPWKGRYSSDWRRRYAPPPVPDPEALPSPFTDALGMAQAFSTHPDPMALYLPGDSHVSPEGASWLAREIARGIGTPRPTDLEENP
ncbi:hypothetical protein [Ideonella sp.]|uniref:hypothetical protein n=1 Tax=Ideonella sp. TaxID=1929293 RepID=UPI0035B136C3